jgi:hypothetical protein
MMTMAPGIICREVLHDDPLLASWVAKLRSRAPHFSHANDHQPGSWIGMYAGSRLLTAYGYTYCMDGTVLVDYAVCEPTKAGRVAMQTLGLVLVQTWKGRPIRFFTEIANRKMRRLFEGVFGAKPSALLYEVYDRG